MIDIENLVFTNVKNALSGTYQSINIVSDYPYSPASFPCVSIVEEDNFVYAKSQDNTNLENHAKVLFTVNVFSNKQNGRKSEAKKIFNSVDSAFADMKFTRTMKEMIPNVDTSIYRIVGRYEAVIGKGQSNGSSTIFQVYTK